MERIEDFYKNQFEELQKLRGGVKTFVLMDDIGARAVFGVRTALASSNDKAKEIDVILHSPGGQPADAYRLIRTFHERYETVNIIVPLWAKSAATLFAFGATRLVMQEFGELGPIDAQIRKDDEDKPNEAWESALNIQSSLSEIENRSSQNFIQLFTNLQANPDIKIGRKQLADMLFRYNASLYAPMIDKVETYEIGSMARYLDIGKMYAKRILKQYTAMEQENIDELLDFLIYDCPDHGYVVDYVLLKAYLPNVLSSKDAPFGEEYDKQLEILSRLLMVPQAEQPMIGFADELMNNNEINEGENEDDDNSDSKDATTESERPGDKSAEDSDEKKSKKKE